MVRERSPQASVVRELSAPYRTRKPGSIRSIQRGATDLLRHLAEAGDLTADTAAHLRAGDVDLDRGRIAVRDFDGRITTGFLIPPELTHPLRLHLAGVRLNHERDRIQGLAGVWIPPEIRRQNPAAAETWDWYWLFPARHVVPDPASGRPWRPPVTTNWPREAHAHQGGRRPAFSLRRS